MGVRADSPIDIPEGELNNIDSFLYIFRSQEKSANCLKRVICLLLKLEHPVFTAQSVMDELACVPRSLPVTRLVIPKSIFPDVHYLNAESLGNLLVLIHIGHVSTDALLSL